MKWGLIEYGLGLTLIFIFGLIVRGANDLVGERWGFLFAVVILALVWGCIQAKERKDQEEQHLREQQRGYYGEDL